MKIAAGCLAGLLSLLLGSVALAAPPKLQGKYAYLSIDMCQAAFSTSSDTYRLGNGSTAPAVKTVNPVSGGIMGANTGYITVTPASPGASNGTFSGSGKLVEGAALRINGAGAPAWGIKNDTVPSAAYSFTDTTATLGSDVYQMTYGNVVSGIAKTVNLIRREGTLNCLVAITLTRQP